MPAPHEHPLGEDLLRHATWLRALARGLVADEATAEDVVQDTWVAALTHRLPAGGGARPWLRQVVRNFARQDHRGRGRRAAREAQARGPSPSPEPEELCGRLESERLLTDRLARLEEPFRSTLLLRYYEDLTPAEIARRQGVPGGTVRWRLKRGLERLRELLDDAHGGDRGAWAALLLPLVRTPAPGAAVAGTTVAFAGWLAMNGLVKLLVAAGAAALFVLGLARSGVLPASLVPSAREEPAAVTFRPLSVAVEPPESLARPDAPPVEVGARRAVDEPAVPSPAPAPAATPVPSAVEALVMDTFGAPIAGARLVAGLPGRPTATGGGDGGVRLELSLEEPAQVRLGFHARGYASERRELLVRPGEAAHAGTVELAPGGAVSGRVTDERGLPVVGASVTLGDLDDSKRSLERQRHYAPSSFAVPLALTDERGAFTLEGVPTGFARLWAHAEGYLGSYTPPVEVRAHEESVGVELVLPTLPPENQIRGIVLDPDGQPVPGARLSFRHESGSSSTSGGDVTDDDGTFRFRLQDDARLWITAQAPGFGPASASAVRTGELELVLRLSRVEPLALHVVDQAGEPVADYAFAVLSPDERFTYQTGASDGAGSGTVTLGSPQEPFLLRVTASGFDLATAGPFDPAALPPGGPTIALTALPGLHGVVLSAGEPLPGATVRLQRALGDDVRYRKDGFLSRMDDAPLDEAETDAEGRFLLTIRAEDEYYVRAEHPGLAPAELGPLLFDPAVAPPPVELHLGRGGAIEGRLHAAPGEDPTGRVVGISRADGHGRTQRLGSDGTYRFERLTPGPWLVTLRDDEIYPGVTTVTTITSRNPTEPGLDDLEWSCEVFEGQTTYHDLRPEHAQRFAFHGRLVVNGEPAAAWVARLAPEDAFFLSDGPRAVLDPDGRFTLEESSEGGFQLVLSPQTEGSPETYVVEPVRLPQDEPWERTLSTGTLVVEGLEPWDGTDLPAVAYLWQGPGGSFALTPLGGDADGLCRVEGALAGRGRLCRPNPEAILDPGSWEVLREVEVPRGGEVRVSVR